MIVTFPPEQDEHSSHPQRFLIKNNNVISPDRPSDLQIERPADRATCRLGTCRLRDLQSEGPADSGTCSPRDLRTQGPADRATCGLRDLQTERSADSGTCRPSDLQIERPADRATCRLGTCRLRDLQTEGPADSGTCRSSDLQTERPADSGTCRSSDLQTLLNTAALFPPTLSRHSFLHSNWLLAPPVGELDSFYNEADLQR
ncbi:uncharacterized protein LOC132958912 [Labrus mixtus]|uniref:uncharacterized protein LOC132958912 n=1 Tax=Labrus mixtus TaxID=508554 RepID=UPI0029C05AF5|nr:uncharacterized protein LOC132958912 [Labrus mixtus]